MISHEHQCIFLHIPRTGGTSIEMWLNDGVSIQPHEQHLLASTAKELYADYWDSYFKFSIVREPVSRVLSCLAFPDEFGLVRHGRSINFSTYFDKFRHEGANLILEHDYRYHPHPDPLNANFKYKPGTVYGNMLDEPIDYIGRTEELADHAAEIKKLLGVKVPFDDWFRYQVSVVRHDRDLDERTLNQIHMMYREDYKRFGYAY